jgi:predicted ATPase
MGATTTIRRMTAGSPDIGAGPVIRTPDQRLRVFISSTLQELAPERAAARTGVDQLRLLPVLFELGARPHPPRELYRSYLAQSHIFLGIYWQSYGWVAPDMGISGLEDEYQLAVDHPKLVYIKRPAPDRDPRLDALLDRIRADDTTSYRSFETPDELRELVENDLAVMLTERFDEEVGAALAPPAPSTAAATSEPLPLAPSPLIGRDVEVSSVLDLLARETVRLVTITGPGGSGKTRLAIELAQRAREAGDRRICFADLTGLRSPDLVVPTIAGALGVRDAGDRSVVDAIGTVLADTPVLLVVDNFEHVMSAAPALAEILTVTHQLDLLVTSRQPLHLRWEQEFPLAPLELPDVDDQRSVDAVAAAPAVELFVQRARRVRPDFVLDATNVVAIAEIARRLDGLPLALELAAARLRILAPSDLLARLEHRLDALGAASPDAPSRHHTLREAISWSHDLSTEDEQILFRRLAVFAGGATLDAIETVCGGHGIAAPVVLELLGSLVDKSLVVSRADAATGQMRFHLLETVREYAMEELVAAGEAEAVFDRHLEWSTALAERGWHEIWDRDMRTWLDLLDREHDNLRLALDHAANAGDRELGLRTAHCLWPLWDMRGHHREGRHRLRALLGVGDELDATPPTVARGRSMSALGWLTALLGDFPSAYELMQQGSAIVRETGTPYDVAWSLGEQGNVAFNLGLTDETRALFDESHQIALELDDTFLIGWNLFGLAFVALLEGDLDTMSTNLHDALDLSRQLYQPWGIAWAQFSLGVVHVLREEWAAADATVTESLELRWSIRDARGTADCLGVLAFLAARRDEPEWAAHLHGANEVLREANGLTLLPFLEPLYHQSLERITGALGPARVEQLWHVGRTTPLAKTVAEALARDPS